MLCLCFYADGPRADNLVRLPAFPTGCSYDRPFRYRDAWIEAGLLKRLQAKPDLLNEKAATLALRFLDANFQDSLVPLREATLQFVSLSPDQNQIYFRLGRLFDFAAVADLQEMVMPVPEGVRGRLFFELTEASASPALQTDEQEDASWTKLTGLIANSNTLPVSAEARSAIFLRVHPPRRRNAQDGRKIHHSWSLGDIHGFRLAEQAPYELVVLHRVPALIGTNTQLTERAEIKFTADSEVVACAPSASQISANYDKHVVTLTGAKASSGWAELHVQTEPKSLQTAAGQLSAYPISLPLKVRVALLYRLWTQAIPIIAVGAALFASTYYSIYKDTHKNSIPFWPSLLASFFASLVIFLFKR